MNDVSYSVFATYMQLAVCCLDLMEPLYTCLALSMAADL